MAYGKVHETFWDDPVIRSLPESAAYLMLYLMTCRHRNRLGLFVLDPGYIAADLRWSADKVAENLAALRNARRIDYDEEHRVVFIRRYLRHNTLENQRVATGAMADLASIPDTPLLADLLAALEENARPHYREIIEQLRNRIANRWPNGLPNGSVNGMAYRGPAQPIPIPVPEPIPSPEPVPTHTKETNRSNHTSAPAAETTARAEGAAAPPASAADAAHTVSWADFWQRYRKLRPSNNPKGKAEKAWRALIRAGVNPAEIMAGLERYAAWCEATGRAGTEFVKQAATFLSREDRWWEQNWSIPEEPGGHAAQSEEDEETLLQKLYEEMV